MQLFIACLLFAAGLVLIIKGGDAFVDASCAIASITGIPKFVIGATVVSVATTLPELLVSLIATAKGAVDMAAGNAVGSVTANIGLILGLSAALLPSKADRSDLAGKGLLMVCAAAALGILSLDGRLSLADSAVMLGLLVYFIYLNIRHYHAQQSARSLEKTKKTADISKTRTALKFLLGAAGIVAGARLLVGNGESIAYFLGIPERIVGLTMVAIGTSLPELATTLSAIAKKESSLSVGNILGANVIDLSLILPACSLVSGGQLEIGAVTARFDIPVLTALMLVAVVPAVFAKRFFRFQGIALIGLYALYLVISALAF